MSGKNKSRADKICEIVAMAGKGHFDGRVTLATVLGMLKVKYHLRELGQREMMVVGAWRYRHDSIGEQWDYCVDLTHYLLTTKTFNGKS